MAPETDPAGEVGARSGIRGIGVRAAWWLIALVALLAVPQASLADLDEELGVKATGSCTGTGLFGDPVTERIEAAIWAVPGGNVVKRVESVYVGQSFSVVFMATVYADSAASSSTYTYAIGNQAGSGTFSTAVGDEIIPVTATQPGEIVVTFTPVAKGFASCGATATASLSVKVLADTAPPRVSSMRPIRARVGSAVTFAYVTADELGETSEAIGIYRSRTAAKPIVALQTRWGKTGVAAVPWKLPARLKPGTYVWCAISSDRAGNRSPARCVRLILVA